MNADNTIYVGVIGGRSCPPGTAEVSYDLGRLIAEEGWVLVSGGLGGVMEQACRGARSAGGVTLGILPGSSREEGNPFLTYSIVTGLGEARNVLVVKTSQAIVAVAGSYGTLSEIALANCCGVPVIGLGSWRLEPEKNLGKRLFAREVRQAQEAVEYVKRLLPG